MAGFPPTKKLRVEEFLRLCKLKGWITDTDIANGLGMSQPQISRLRREEVRPGDRFKDRCEAIWGGSARDMLFEDEEPAEPAGTDEPAVA